MSKWLNLLIWGPSNLVKIKLGSFFFIFSSLWRHLMTSEVSKLQESKICMSIFFCDFNFGLTFQRLLLIVNPES